MAALRDVKLYLTEEAGQIAVSSQMCQMWGLAAVSAPKVPCSPFSEEGLTGNSGPCSAD